MRLCGSVAQSAEHSSPKRAAARSTRARPAILACEDDMVIAPPNSVTVEAAGRVVLYDAQERPLARQIGFRA
jgi:hypothetical protein